jgi:uncharacterized protein YrzB (UPF0473 family)
MNENETVTITLDSDNGTVDCEVAAVFEAEEKRYIAVLPLVETGDDEAEIQLFRYNETDDGIEVFNIEDERDFDIAFDYFERIMAEDNNDDD